MALECNSFLKKSKPAINKNMSSSSYVFKASPENYSDIKSSVI